MRSLTALIVLSACASDPDSTQAVAIVDASVAQCPRRFAAGVVRADRFPDGRCLYYCSSEFRLCGAVVPADGGPVDFGVCTPFSDPNNCGDCGVRCVAGETCRVTSQSYGQYVCTTRIAP